LVTFFIKKKSDKTDSRLRGKGVQEHLLNKQYDKANAKSKN